MLKVYALVGHLAGVPEYVKYPEGDLLLGLPVGRIDLSHYGRQNRGSRWDFNDRDVLYTVLLGYLVHLRSYEFGKFVGLFFPVVFAHQIDLYLRKVGSLPKVVVPDEPVEVKGCRRPHVYLIVGDYVLLGYVLSQLLSHPQGLFKGSSLGHV